MDRRTCSSDYRAEQTALTIGVRKGVRFLWQWTEALQLTCRTSDEQLMYNSETNLSMKLTVDWVHINGLKCSGVYRPIDVDRNQSQHFRDNNLPSILHSDSTPGTVSIDGSVGV